MIKKELANVQRISLTLTVGCRICKPFEFVHDRSAFVVVMKIAIAFTRNIKKSSDDLYYLIHLVHFEMFRVRAIVSAH